MRGATSFFCSIKAGTKFQPTLPVRGATHGHFIPLPIVVISTHAPRAGSDAVSCPWPGRNSNFNPRSPCGERPGLFNNIVGTVLFQPTLPVRGATPAIMRSGSGNLRFQPTLPVRGATLPFFFSSFASRFQPTLPVRGATHDDLHLPDVLKISTHAPRAGSDTKAEIC